MKKTLSEPHLSVYGGVVCRENTCVVALVNHARRVVSTRKLHKKDATPAGIIAFLRTHAKAHKQKVMALGVVGARRQYTEQERQDFFSTLWLEEDIVPLEIGLRARGFKRKAVKAAKRVAEKFTLERVIDVELGPRREVKTHHLVRLSDYREVAGKEAVDEVENLAQLLKERGERIAFFSSTPRGGGVAIMRHALMRLFTLLGIDASWHVMYNNEKVFHITKKKFHNILQGVAGPEDKLTEKDKQAYRRWIKKNAKYFTPIFKEATTIIIDDPQPSGMIPFIKKINPKARIIYRSHIQIDTELLRSAENEAQRETWEFLWPNIRAADVFVSHPVPEFVPHPVSQEKVVYMPATTDEFDGLNKPLTKEQTAYYLSVFNAYLKDQQQTPLDTSRPYITQVARFDPSKGIPDLIVAYCTLRKMFDEEGYPHERMPQLVIAGHGALDDPEGMPIFQETLSLLQMDVNKPYADDVKVARVEHSDQLLNAVLSESKIATQLSYKEGFEVKVTEALAKGKPVVAYKTGGIVLQIEDNKTGFLVPAGETHEVAERLYQLLTDDELYALMSTNAKQYLKRDFFTIGNALAWMRIIAGRKEVYRVPAAAPQAVGATKR